MAGAWEPKAAFRHFWKHQSVLWAGGFLNTRYDRATRSRLESLKKMAHMLGSHEKLLMNWFRLSGKLPASSSRTPTTSDYRTIGCFSRLRLHEHRNVSHSRTGSQARNHPRRLPTRRHASGLARKTAENGDLGTRERRRTLTHWNIMVRPSLDHHCC
jgi:hypothetical protein